MVSKASCLACMKTNLLLLLTIAGVIVGICFGIGMRALDPPLSNLDIGLLVTFLQSLNFMKSPFFILYPELKF